MKYSSKNEPLVCMQTQSTCYKGTRKMTIKGVLWHSTGANNPTLKRYVQPSDIKPGADTYSKEKWIEVLGKNTYKNDWNHIEREAGLNCWIGKLADGTVTTVQTMPWDFRPWGCGSGKNGSCNDGWIQFEICEDGLTDAEYFNKAYTEACELTAYLCKKYNIDPTGTVIHNGVTVPTILCHKDSHKLGLGSNHGDVDNWFPKHKKSMETARTDVAALLKSSEATETTTKQLYRVRKSKDDSKSQLGAYSILQNAINRCNEAGEGYHVFDNAFNVVYSYAAPSIKEEVKEVAVYDLDYPNKVKIIDKTIQRTNMDCAKAINKILSYNADFDIEIAKAFFKLASRYHIDPLMAIAQSILETGWFKYEQSAVTADQHNYCGMGVVINGIKGAAFDTIEDGVTAQLQHLFAYGCKEILPNDETIIDPRFSLVTRGIAPYWQQLAGRWACPGYDSIKYATPAEAMAAENTYGQKILNIYGRLIDTTATEEDINKYFEIKKPVQEELKPEESVPVEPDVEPESTPETVPEVDTSDKQATDLASLIFSIIKKLVQMFADLFSKKQ
jgi:flagellum-specific peptidoglycan hydrolase FlgJ